MTDAELLRKVNELLLDLLDEHEAFFFEAQDLDTIGPNPMGNRILELVRLTAPRENREGIMARIRAFFDRK